MNRELTYRTLKGLIFLAFVVFTQGSWAQNNRVSINPFSQSILIGEQVRVEINVQAEASENVIWPALTDTVTAQIELIGQPKTDTIFGDTLNHTDILGYQKQWVITSFDSGLWAFPELTVWIDSVPFTTEAFLFEVNTVEVDTSKGFITIVEPIELPMTFMEYVQAYYKYGLYAYGVLMVLAILAYIFGKKYVGKETEDSVIVIAPHILAIDRLHQLEEEQLWQKGAFKAYHIQVSDIVREYIENRFHVPVKESTTDEIKHLLKITRMDKTIRKEIIDSLKISDLVKFAKAIPLPEENEACLQTAYKLVDATKIEEVSETEIAESMENPETKSTEALITETENTENTKNAENE